MTGQCDTTLGSSEPSSRSAASKRAVQTYLRLDLSVAGIALRSKSHEPVRRVQLALFPRPEQCAHELVHSDFAVFVRIHHQHKLVDVRLAITEVVESAVQFLQSNDPVPILLHGTGHQPSTTWLMSKATKARRTASIRRNKTRACRTSYRLGPSSTL